MGCYPIFCCRHWRELGHDIRALRDDLVSLSLVADPFGDYNPEDLHESFSVVVPFKEHYVLDLTLPVGAHYSRHHRRSVARANRAVHVQQCQEPRSLLDEWIELFDLLIARHQLTGVKAFSRVAFEKQLSIPGLVAFRATHAGENGGDSLVVRTGRRWLRAPRCDQRARP
jgi:hypothetical protein